MAFLIGSEVLDRPSRHETMSRDAAIGSAYALHLRAAREALLGDPSKALRNPHSRRHPTIAACDLYESLTPGQQQTVAEIVARAAREGDGMAQTLIDALAVNHAELNCEEDE